MSFTGDENHDITATNAGVMTKRYRDSFPAGSNPTLGGFFGKTALLAILNGPNCVGIRYYYALDSAGNKQLVLVGADASENDLMGHDNPCKETSILCPTHCGANDVLNS